MLVWLWGVCALQSKAWLARRLCACRALKAMLRQWRVQQGCL